MLVNLFSALVKDFALNVSLILSSTSHLGGKIFSNFAGITSTYISKIDFKYERSSLAPFTSYKSELISFTSFESHMKSTKW